MLMANVVDIGEGEKETSRVLDVSDQGLLYYFESGIQDCLDGKKNMFEIGDISRCIQRLSASNSNKESIGKGQTIRLLLNTLKFPKASQKDLEGAAGALWALAFFDQNCQKIISLGGKEILQSHTKSESQILSRNIRGTLWQLLGKGQAPIPSDAPKVVQSDQAVGGVGTVMISYNWKHQNLILTLRDQLRNAGIDIWIDVEQMRGHTLEAMATAVESSAIVLICGSRLYYESPNCRAEADYAFVQRKKIIPLIVEQGYKPSGWLGMIFGTKLFYDISDPNIFGSKVQGLIREILNEKPLPTPSASSSVIPTPIPTYASTSAEIQKLASLSMEEIQKWLASEGFQELCQGFLREEIKGEALVEMRRLAESHPGVLYQVLLPALGMKKVGE